MRKTQTPRAHKYTQLIRLNLALRFSRLVLRISLSLLLWLICNSNLWPCSCTMHSQRSTRVTNSQQLTQELNSNYNAERKQQRIQNKRQDNKK